MKLVVPDIPAWNAMQNICKVVFWNFINIKTIMFFPSGKILLPYWVKLAKLAKLFYRPVIMLLEHHASSHNLLELQLDLKGHNETKQRGVSEFCSIRTYKVSRCVTECWLILLCLPVVAAFITGAPRVLFLCCFNPIHLVESIIFDNSFWILFEVSKYLTVKSLLVN